MTLARGCNTIRAVYALQHGKDRSREDACTPFAWQAAILSASAAARVEQPAAAPLAAGESAMEAADAASVRGDAVQIRWSPPPRGSTRVCRLMFRCPILVRLHVQARVRALPLAVARAPLLARVQELICVTVDWPGLPDLPWLGIGSTHV